MLNLLKLRLLHVDIKIIFDPELGSIEAVASQDYILNDDPHNKIGKLSEAGEMRPFRIIIYYDDTD